VIPHLSPWIWLAVIATVEVAATLFALSLCKAASDADEVARMFADDCPDELEP